MDYFENIFVNTAFLNTFLLLFFILPSQSKKYTIPFFFFFFLLRPIIKSGILELPVVYNNLDYISYFLLFTSFFTTLSFPLKKKNEGQFLTLRTSILIFFVINSFSLITGSWSFFFQNENKDERIAKEQEIEFRKAQTKIELENFENHFNFNIDTLFNFNFKNETLNIKGPRSLLFLEEKNGNFILDRDFSLIFFNRKKEILAKDLSKPITIIIIKRGNKEVGKYTNQTTIGYRQTIQLNYFLYPSLKNIGEDYFEGEDPVYEFKSKKGAKIPGKYGPDVNFKEIEKAIQNKIL